MLNTDEKDWDTFLKRLPAKLKRYIKSCRPPPDADPKRNPGRLPTLAGFCNFLGVGLSGMDRLHREDPLLFDRICTALEDEALNYSPTPTLLSAYLKKRLGYAEEREGDVREVTCNEMRLIFEHDIEEDGE